MELKQKKKERTDRRKQKSQGKSISGLHQLTLQRKDDQSVWDINDFRARAIHKKLGEMIAIDSQPLYIVEDPGFISFVKNLEPRYKIPSRKYFTEKIFPKIIKGVKVEVDKILHSPNIKYYSFTTDVWSTNTAHRCLLSMTAHWVSDSYERLSAVLHVTLLEESHTGSYICENSVKCSCPGKSTKKMYILYSVIMHLTWQGQ